MSIIKVTVRVEDIGCTAEIKVDTNEDPDFWAQFETTGEGVEQCVTDLTERVGAQLRAEYDKRDAVNQRVKELGA